MSHHRADRSAGKSRRLNAGLWLRIGWIAAFVGILVAPLFRMTVMPEVTVSQWENRNLAPLPDMSGESLKDIVRGVEAYWNDHFGFRGSLVFLHNWMVWKAFAQSGVPWVTVGQDGWFYYEGDHSNDDVLGRMQLSDADVARWAAVVQAKKDWFHRQGILYVLLFAPDKQSIYPEYLPPEMQRRTASFKRMDRLLEGLRRYTDAEIIDVRDVLLREKHRNPVFFKTDSHWNWQGAYAAYRILVESLGIAFPEIYPLETSRLIDIERNFLHGDLRMGLDGVIWETERVWLPKHPCAQVSTTLPWDRYLYQKHCPTSSKRRAIVLRDSFMDHLEPYLSEHFQDIVYIWKRWDEASGTEHRLYKEWIGRIHPDVVIEERVERLVGQIPIATPEQRFDYAQSPLTLLDGAGRGFDGMVSCHQAHLEEVSAGLLIHALDEDPSVCFTQPSPWADGSLILRISIDSPADTVMQVFYRSAQESDYCEEKSRKIGIKTGENIVFVSLDDRTGEDMLRLDPGGVPGDYLLRSLEIRRDVVEDLIRKNSPMIADKAALR